MAEGLFKRPLPWLAAIVLLYLALLLPTVNRYGIGWDELTDLRIARSYLPPEGGWLGGSTFDPANTRLPMYATAIVFALTGTESLMVARLVSCAMGALTIVGTYFFCRREYGWKKGLLASAILAVNPYFLSFSRIAFTESDLFFTCALIWVMVFLSVLAEKRTAGWAVATALVLGLAISSKASALALYPAVFIFLLFRAGKGKKGGRVAGFLYVTLLLSVLLLGGLVAGWRIERLTGMARSSGNFVGFHYLFVFLCWLAIVLYWFLRRGTVLKPFVLVCFVLVFAFLTFIVIPPAHTTSPEIVDFLFGPSLSDYSGQGLAFVPEAATLLFGSVLFKSSLLIGGWLLLSLLITAVEFPRRKEVRLPLLVFLFYLIFILKMPWTEPWFMIPLMPIFAAFGADQFFRVFERKRFVAVALGAAAVGLLVVDLLLCYPDYNFNGHQWLGSRYLAGKSTVGYRSIVQTTSDGVEQAIRWANENIEEGATVVGYIRPRHIFRELCPNPRFQVVNGFKRWRKRWDYAFDEADYVITTLDADIRHGFRDDNPEGSIYQYRYDRPRLEKEFEKVFSVKRAFGFEVGTVWKRKEIDSRKNAQNTQK